MREIYDTLIAAGHAKEYASATAFKYSTKADKIKQLEDGATYSEQEVRQSIVHCGDDIALLCYYSNKIYGALSAIKTMLVLLIFLIAFLVILIITAALVI